MDKRCILDFDSTVETVYGSQEGAETGYNNGKHGRLSYHPILAFDGLSQALLNAELREGNAGSATGFKDFLHRTESQCSGAAVEYIRMDAGFAGEEVYAEAEHQAVKGYVVQSGAGPPRGDRHCEIPADDRGADAKRTPADTVCCGEACAPDLFKTCGQFPLAGGLPSERQRLDALL